MQAAVASAVSVFCGQGARRARNWRHNRPNSPYRKAREAMYASGSGLCPAQKAALEARLVAELQQKLQQQQSALSAAEEETTDDC